MKLSKNSDSNGDHLIAGAFLSRHWGALYSVFAGWRGKLDAERLLKGNRSFIRPVVEGFIVGFTLIVLISAFGLASEALASGGIYDNVLYDPWRIKSWVELIRFTLQM